MPTTPAGADQPHSDGHALDHAVDILAEDLLIFVQQRFALGGIDQYRIGLAGQLMRGKPAPPAPTTPASATSWTVMLAMRNDMVTRDLAPEGGTWTVPSSIASNWGEWDRCHDMVEKWLGWPR